MTVSRTSRVLFVVALVALAAFAWVELPHRRLAERENVGARRLFPPFARMIDRVVVLRPDARIVLEARNTHWEIVEPVRDAAEYSRVASLLATFEKAEVARNVGPAVNPVAYGLTPATATVWIVSGTDTMAHLEIGALTIDDAFAFARRDDGDVVLVPPDLLSVVTLPVDAYRDQHIVRFDLSEVESFVVHPRMQNPIRWTRRGDDAWFTVVDGDTVRGDSTAVPTFLRRFRGMRVLAFVDPADTSGAFVDPAGIVTLHKHPPAPPVTLRFATHAGTLYWNRVDGRGRVVVVDGDVPNALDASPATLRDRRLLQFSPLRAKRIHVATPDTSAVLVRAGDAWALPNPALGRIDRGAAAAFIRSLRALRYTRVVEGTPRDADPAALTVQVTADGDTILDELRGRPRGGASDAWIVTSRSSGTLAELPAVDVDALVALLRSMRDPSPLRTRSR